MNMNTARELLRSGYSRERAQESCYGDCCLSTAQKEALIDLIYGDEMPPLANREVEVRYDPAQGGHALADWVINRLTPIPTGWTLTVRPIERPQEGP